MPLLIRGVPPVQAGLYRRCFGNPTPPKVSSTPLASEIAVTVNAFYRDRHFESMRSLANRLDVHSMARVVAQLPKDPACALVALKVGYKPGELAVVSGS